MLSNTHPPTLSLIDGETTVVKFMHWKAAVTDWIRLRRPENSQILKILNLHNEAEKQQQSAIEIYRKKLQRADLIMIRQAQQGPVKEYIDTMDMSMKFSKLAEMIKTKFTANKAIEQARWFEAC